MTIFYNLINKMYFIDVFSKQSLQKHEMCKTDFVWKM